MRRIVIVGALSAAALLLLGTSRAAAQHNVTKLESGAEMYTSPEGFTIVLPRGWRAKDDSVQFHAPGRKGDFEDTLKLTVVPPIAFTATVVKALERELRTKYEKMYLGFRFTRFRKQTFGTFPGVHAVGKYTHRGAKAVINQALVTTSKGTVIATCTLKASRAAKHGKLCERAFASIQLATVAER